jgi:hypothetical protein
LLEQRKRALLPRKKTEIDQKITITERKNTPSKIKGD